MGKISARSAVSVPEIEEDDYVAPVRSTMRVTEDRMRDADMRPEPMPQFAPVQEEYVYERPNNLRAPPPRQGYEQRWVRMDNANIGDPTSNYRNKMLEGFVPRDPKTLSDHYRLLQAASAGVDVIRVGSLVLCEKPVAMVNAKKKFLREEVAKLNRSINAEHEKVSQEGQARTGIPLVHEETESVSRGRRPATMVS